MKRNKIWATTNPMKKNNKKGIEKKYFKFFGSWSFVPFARLTALSNMLPTMLLPDEPELLVFLNVFYKTMI